MYPLARAGRNLLAKTAGEVLARLFFLLLFIYAARVLGVGDFGRFSFALSVAALAFIGMDLGLNVLFVREGAKHRERAGDYAGTLLLLKLVLAAAVLALLAGFCRLRGLGEAETWLVMAVAASQVLWGLAELGVAGLNALERMDQEALVKSLGRLAALVAAGGLLWAGYGLAGFVAGLVAANALAAAVGLGLLARRTGLRLRLERGFLGRLARESLPLALTNIFVLVFVRVDMVMLEAMGRPFAEIGWYAAGVRVIDALGMVPALVSGAALPVLSSLAAESPQAFGRLFRQAQRLLLILGLPAAVGLWAVRQQAAVLVYGPEFADTARAFAWLAPVLAFLFVNFLQLGALTALGRQSRCAVATGVCVAVNVGLNLWLIPSHGFVGAAAATLATEAALFALCAGFIRRALGPSGLGRRAWRPALAAGVMGLVLWALPAWPLAVMLPLGAGLYAALLLAAGGLTPAELRELWSLVRRPEGYAAPGEGRG